MTTGFHEQRYESESDHGISSAFDSGMRTVVIVGPPWPQSGTARLFENQVEFYRSRGFASIFIAVPIHCSYVESYPEWNGIRAGLLSIGADRLFTAAVNYRRFVRSKYAVWARRAFRPTALDWIIMTGASADIPEQAVSLIQNARVELIHVNHVFTIGFAKRLRRRVVRNGRRIPMILETHDVQAQLLKDRGEINPWTHRTDTLDRLVHSEDASLCGPRAFLHCSVDDLEHFKARISPRAHVLALPTIDEAFIAAVKSHQSSTQPIDLLYVGQSTEPNLASIKWFFEHVWPLIADQGYRVSIVGKVETLVREHLHEIHEKFRGFFTGHVSELAPYYSAARCVFAPMVSGTGISVKTVEALAVGKPFVGTSKAYRGMPMDRLNSYGLYPHDTPQAFARAITQALSDGTRAADVSRRAYEALFSKSAAFAAREEAFRTAAMLDECDVPALRNDAKPVSEG